MDILFINPPWYKTSGNIWKNVSACLPPFGPALLASLARNKGYSVSILDCNALRIGLDRVKENLPRGFPKFIGITASTILFKNAMILSRIVKEKYPKTKIIFGGVHASLRPKEVLSLKWVDYVVMGEGEYSFLDLISGKNPEEIKGIGFKKGSQIVINPNREIIPDINVFPLPAYDLLPMDKYYPALGSYKRKPSFGIFTSRGCPGHCTFCKGNLLGGRIRYRSAEKIIEEIEFLQKNYNIRDITFYDDTFTSSKTRVKQFCHLLLEKKIDLTWCCFSRVDTVDLDLLLEMKKAGCYQVMYGAESGDQQILNNLKKMITLEKIEETVVNTKKAGMEVRLAFMLGSPGETEETMKKTIKYAISLDPDLVSFNITTPYPGTEMFDWAEKNNYLIDKNWEHYDLARPVMELPSVSSKKVLYHYKKAHFQFYLRPQYILKRLLKIRSVDDLKRNIASFLGLIKFVFSN